MPATDFSEIELAAYLDEALPPDAMARIEEAVRREAKLAQRLVAINGRRDAGLHSLGEIWRRNRLTCPTRVELGSYLLGVIDEAQARYLAFHLDELGCRYCRANLDDLQRQQPDAPEAATRRRKYFQSSASYLRPR
jgi:hypothetical protein